MQSTSTAKVDRHEKEHVGPSTGIDREDTGQVSRKATEVMSYDQRRAKKI
jgi:hypothetical protein